MPEAVLSADVGLPEPYRAVLRARGVHLSVRGVRDRVDGPMVAFVTFAFQSSVEVVDADPRVLLCACKRQRQ